MNDKLRNYATKPDPEVWERIEKSMPQRGVRRQAWSAVAGAAIVALAIVGVVFWPGRDSEVAVPSVVSEVAQAMPRSEAAAPVAQQAEVAEITLQSEPKAVGTEPAKAQPTTVAQPVATPSAVQTEGPTAAARPVVVAPVTGAAVASLTGGEAGAPAAEEVRVPSPVVSEPQPQDIPVAETSEPNEPSGKATVGNGNEDTILWLPNIFVPGSDDAEINQFRARLNHPGDVLTNYRMNVFNRSGNLVFMSNDINNGWDGKYKGRDLPQSTYVYVIYYTDKDGFHHQRKGTITLVR